MVKTLISSCSFYKNNANADGGSLYIKDSECIQSKICCTFSSAPNFFGGFSKVESSGRKFLFDSSISSCSAKVSSFYHCYGNSQVSNINSSFHEIQFDAGYTIESPIVESHLNLSTIVNCSSSKQGVVYNAGGVISIKRCNYKMNYLNGTDGIIYCGSATTFTECCFINNTANKLFINNKPTVTKCYFDNKDVKSTGNAKILSTTELLNLSFPHLSRRSCDGIYYLVEEHEDNKHLEDQPKSIKIAIEMFRDSSIIQLTRKAMS